MLETIFSGIGSAILTLIVTLLIQRKNRVKPEGKAYEVLQSLGKLLEQANGEYFFTRSQNDNYNVAQTIYNCVDNKVLCTAFNENPSLYGDSDLIRGFKYGGSLVTRITSRNVCNSEDENKVLQSMQKSLEGSKLLVIPESAHITKIDGVFARLSDNSYLAFIAFRNNELPEKNKGVIFRDGIAKGFFEYYEGIVEKYKTK